MKEQLLSGSLFRMKTIYTNTYRINGSIIEVMHGNWSPVAVVTSTENEIEFKTFSYLGTPTWESFVDLEQIELI